jgi:hypothetical protein
VTLELSREARVVFLTASSSAGDAEIERLLGAGVAWDRLLAVATMHKAAASVCRALERIQSAAVPPQVTQQLRLQRMVGDFHALHLRQRLLETLQVLQRRNVTVMLLKGAAMGASVYESFSERPMADIDLLVRPDEVGEAAAALDEAGWIADTHPERAAFYERHHHLAPLKDARGSGHAIELHVRGFPPPNPFGDVAAEMWSDAQITTSEFSGAVLPSRPHLLVYACVHFAWSHKMRKGAWRTIRDCAELGGTGLDWDAVVDTAKRWKAASACYWTLRLAASLAQLKVPAAVLTAMRPPTAAPLLNILERHAVAVAVPGERPACPSERMSDLMWRAAIRPRWSGHIDGRPAEHRPEWVDSGPQETVATDSPGPTRASPREWWRYFSGAVLPRSRPS